MALLQTHDVDAVAQILGRSRRSVMTRCRQIGRPIGGRRERKWTADEDAELLRLGVAGTPTARDRGGAQPDIEGGEESGSQSGSACSAWRARARR